MRFLTFTISLIITTLLCHAEGVATWLSTSHNFGTFKEELGKVSCEMKMINTGDSDIKITKVRATCGCTATSYTLEPITPGDTASVIVTYNPNGRPGRFDKDVYVYTTGTPDKCTLTIKGNVIGSHATIQQKYPISVGALKLEQRIIPFGEISKGRSRTQFISLYNQSDDTLKAVFSNVPQYLHIGMVPEIVLPGELSTITITYHSEKNDDWGFSQDVFTMETLPASGYSNNTVAGIGNIEVTARLVEKFNNLSQKERAEAPIAKLSCHKIDFNRIKTNENPIKKSFTITNTGKSKLYIRKIYSNDKNIEIKCNKYEIKPNKTATVEISVYPQKLDKLLNSTMEVITNDPNNPQQTVRLVGQIIK